MIYATSFGTMSAEQLGSGPDLVLIHSLLTDRRVYDRIVPTLARHHRLTLVDLPGYGHSDRVVGGIEAYVDAMAELLDAADVAAGAAVLGNGLGAFVALGLAIRHPERVGKLVLAGAAARFPEDVRGAFDMMAQRATTEGMGGVADVAVARIFADDYAAAHPDMVAERRETLLNFGVPGFVDGCRAIRDVDFSSALEGMAIRTLVVVGSEDRATLPAYGQELAAALPSAEYLELPGVAHGPQLQAPDGFLAAIQPFLDTE